MIPAWLNALALVSIAIGIASALWVLADVHRNPPHMAIMKAVWPLAALFGSLGLVWFYLRHGREQRSNREGRHPGEQTGGHEHGHAHHHHHTTRHSFAISVAKGALHCGAGCTLGDIIAETLALAFPALLIPFGYPNLFNEKIFAVWGLDFIVAFGLGIVFQYFAIAPMRDLSVKEGLLAAVKADAASLISWQVGMYGFMAIAHFGIFKGLLGAEVTAADPLFWFAMQIAMLAGFVTAYPVNWWLIRMGVKEEM